MTKFEVDLQWKPPCKNCLVTIHRIQWQECHCCPPLRLLISSSDILNGQKVIVEIEKHSKKFCSLYHLLNLGNSTYLSIFDELLTYMKLHKKSSRGHLLLQFQP